MEGMDEGSLSYKIYIQKSDTTIKTIDVTFIKECENNLIITHYDMPHELK